MLCSIPTRRGDTGRRCVGGGAGFLGGRYPTAEAGEDHRYPEPIRLMPRYMLDADTVSYALRGQGNVSKHLLARRPSEVCISAITLGELRYGVEAKRSEKLRRSLGALLEDIAVIAFDEGAAERFASLAATLARKVRETLHVLALPLDREELE